jgi:hypothetical protein
MPGPSPPPNPTHHSFSGISLEYSPWGSWSCAAAVMSAGSGSGVMPRPPQKVKVVYSAPEGSRRSGLVRFLVGGARDVKAVTAA